MKFLPFSKYPTPKGVVVKGETLTVPCLAPTLIELLDSAVHGDQLPDNGLGNNYDKSEKHGLERTSRPRTYNDLISEENAASEAENEQSEDVSQTSEVSQETKDEESAG